MLCNKLVLQLTCLEADIHSVSKHDTALACINFINRFW